MYSRSQKSACEHTLISVTCWHCAFFGLHIKSPMERLRDCCHLWIKHVYCPSCASHLLSPAGILNRFPRVWAQAGHPPSFFLWSLFLLITMEPLQCLAQVRFPFTVSTSCPETYKPAAGSIGQVLALASVLTVTHSAWGHTSDAIWGAVDKVVVLVAVAFEVITQHAQVHCQVAQRCTWKVTD